MMWLGTDLFHMACEVRLLIESLIALAATVWPLVGMAKQVVAEISYINKSI